MTTTDVIIPPHPAKWSPAVLDVIADRLDDYTIGAAVVPSILDPFAGRDIDRLAATSPGSQFYGIELEPEWAAASDRCQVGDALDLPWGGSTFDALVTSPAYGNRMADAHDAKDTSKRITYRHQLGRMPSDGSSAVLQWGPEYRAFHERAWSEALRVLRGRALVMVNISNHIRDGDEQRVVEFHLNAWLRLGATIEEIVKIPTPRSRFGANHEARVDGERLLVLRAPEKPAGTML